MISRLFSAEPGELIAALFSQPLFSLVIAAIIGMVALIAHSARREDESNEATHRVTHEEALSYGGEIRWLRIAMIVVIASVAAENLLATFAPPSSDTVSWWRYAFPLLTALLCLVVLVALIRLRGTSSPRQPTITGRRTWTTFNSRVSLIVGGVAVIALTATTVAAGLASAPDRAGRWVWLEIPIANTDVDPLRLTFYGWAYGVPVLLSLSAVVVFTVAVLHVNAARPFQSPETLAVERHSRSVVASGIVGITTSGTLLSLAAAWRFISEVGTAAGLVVDGEGGPDVYEVAWRYSEFARYAGWAAPAVEIIAFLILLVLFFRFRRTSPDHAHGRAATSVAAETAR